MTIGEYRDWSVDMSPADFRSQVRAIMTDEYVYNGFAPCDLNRDRVWSHDEFVFCAYLNPSALPSGLEKERPPVHGPTESASQVFDILEAVGDTR